jgi:hypothetical protein
VLSVLVALHLRLRLFTFVYVCLPRNPDVLRRLDTEGFPVGRVEEFVFAEEALEARVACKTVALFLASVVEEVVRVVEADAAIHAHAVLELFHAFALLVPLSLVSFDTTPLACAVIVVLMRVAVVVTGNVVKPH